MANEQWIITCIKRKGVRSITAEEATQFFETVKGMLPDSVRVTKEFVARGSLFVVGPDKVCSDLKKEVEGAGLAMMCRSDGTLLIGANNDWSTRFLPALLGLVRRLLEKAKRLV